MVISSQPDRVCQGQAVWLPNSEVGYLSGVVVTPGSTDGSCTVRTDDGEVAPLPAAALNRFDRTPLALVAACGQSRLIKRVSLVISHSVQPLATQQILSAASTSGLSSSQALPSDTDALRVQEVHVAASELMPRELGQCHDTCEFADLAPPALSLDNLLEMVHLNDAEVLHGAIATHHAPRAHRARCIMQPLSAPLLQPFLARGSATSIPPTSGQSQWHYARSTVWRARRRSILMSRTLQRPHTARPGSTVVNRLTPVLFSLAVALSAVVVVLSVVVVVVCGSERRLGVRQVTAVRSDQQAYVRRRQTFWVLRQAR